MSSHGRKFNNAWMNSIQWTLSKTWEDMQEIQNLGTGRQDFRDRI